MGKAPAMVFQTTYREWVAFGEEPQARSKLLRAGDCSIVYNNYYNLPNADTFEYAWGVGVQSKIYAQNNFFQTDPSITPDQFIRRFRGGGVLITKRLPTAINRLSGAALYPSNLLV